MTLIDSQSGIRAVYERARPTRAAPRSTSISWCHGWARRIEVELANWVPADEVDRWSDRYRELYPEIALPLIDGAARRARVAQGRTAAWPRDRHHRQARPQRAAPRRSARAARRRRVRAGVARRQGDSARPSRAPSRTSATTCTTWRPRRLAGVIGIGVTTGPSSADELRDAGADVVLTSLEDFPDWLASAAGVTLPTRPSRRVDLSLTHLGRILKLLPSSNSRCAPRSPHKEWRQ